MCGITLAYSSRSDLKEAFINKGLDLLIHRGQDEVSRIILNDKLSIGHRRLAITGKSGIQPISYKNVSVLTNGEFYDFEEIKQNHEYLYKTDSDAEILIPLYLKNKLPKMLSELNGEFVFIIVDQDSKEIIAVRDRIGNKTLYYANSEDGFFIASEIKAFKSIRKLKFNDEVLLQKMQMQYHAPSDTLFEGIYQVEPGSILRYNYETNDLSIEIYEDLYSSPNSKALDSNHVLDLLKQSVSRRILNQKPAIALSGGLDSSIILDLVQEINPEINDCFSVSFTDGGIYDEKELVQILAKKYNLNLNVLNLSQRDLIDSLEESLYFAEDVAVNLHMSAKFLLFKEMNKKGFKVSLSGEGSDEFFLGYTHFYPLKDNYLKGMHLPDKEMIGTPYENLPLFLQAKLSIGFKIQKFLNQKNKFTSYIKFPRKLDSVSTASYLWTKYALSNSILLALGDKMEMASTIEGRTPFLDKDLLNYIMSLPLSDKMNKIEDKCILRQLFRNRLPSEIVNKPKHPFISPPMLNSLHGIEFFRKTLNEWKTDLINKEAVNCKLNELINSSEEEQRLFDPVFMIMSSLALIQKRMIDD